MVLQSRERKPNISVAHMNDLYAVGSPVLKM